MKGSDLILLVLTFFTGAFAGAYLYITVFAPAYGEKPEVINVEETEFLLRGEMYGACTEEPQGCGSFSLRANRAYEYTEASEDVSIAQGKVTTEVFDELETAITASNLNALEAVSQPCSSQSGVTEFRYLLIVDGEDYALEACVAEVASSPLGQELEMLWPMVATSTSGLSDMFGEGVGHFLEHEIDKRFEYDESEGE